MRPALGKKVKKITAVEEVWSDKANQDPNSVHYQVPGGPWARKRKASPETNLAIRKDRDLSLPQFQPKPANPKPSFDHPAPNPGESRDAYWSRLRDTGSDPVLCAETMKQFYDQFGNQRPLRKASRRTATPFRFVGVKVANPTNLSLR